MRTPKPKLERRQFTRSISLPVQDCLSHSWAEFCQMLHAAWRQSTDLANWASHTLYRLDVVRVPGMLCLPKYEAIDLYAMAFGRAKERPARKEAKGTLPIVEPHYDDPSDFWDGQKICAATLLRKVQRKYLQERGKIVWRRDRRTPQFLYPFPFPVHKDAWLPFRNDKGAPVIALNLAGNRVSLRLRGGDEFRTALDVLDGIASGEIAQQELSICSQCNFGRNGRRYEERDPGGSNRVPYRVMLRISYRREAVVPIEADTVEALCQTGRDPFLTLSVGDLPPFVIHAPQVRRWIVEHQAFLQSFADDLKYEKRWPAKRRRALNGYRERRCEKHARRMKTFFQETAAHVVCHAIRKKATRILLDDEDRNFVSPFPWHQLEESFRTKCENEGLSFRLAASGKVVDKTPIAARVEVS